MLEIPESTCNITVKRKKRKLFPIKKKSAEEAKDSLIGKINAENAREFPQEQVTETDGFSDGGLMDLINEKQNDAEFVSDGAEQFNSDFYETRIETERETTDDNRTVNIKQAVKTKKKFRFGVVGVQLAVVGALIATIFLTNAFVPNSGINEFINGVFGRTQTVTDERTYLDFGITLPVDDASQVTVSDGIMSVGGKGSVYSPCDGTIESAVKNEDGRFDLVIKHNDNFRTEITGLDYFYGIEGGPAYSTLPIGYTLGENATICFVGKDGEIIKGYDVTSGSLVWEI